MSFPETYVRKIKNVDVELVKPSFNDNNNNSLQNSTCYQLTTKTVNFKIVQI